MDRRRFIADRLRTAREMVHLSQEALGQMLGMSGAAISDYERAKSSITAENLERLAKALSLPVAYFYGSEATDGSDYATEPGFANVYFRYKKLPANLKSSVVANMGSAVSIAEAATEHNTDKANKP